MNRFYVERTPRGRLCPMLTLKTQVCGVTSTHEALSFAPVHTPDAAHYPSAEAKRRPGGRLTVSEADV